MPKCPAATGGKARSLIITDEKINHLSRPIGLGTWIWSKSQYKTRWRRARRVTIWRRETNRCHVSK